MSKVTPDLIRLQMLALEYPEVVQKYALSKVQLNLYLWLHGKTVTAADLANDLDVSIQDASTRLKRLYDKGYVSRSKEFAESGGVEYVYSQLFNDMINWELESK